MKKFLLMLMIAGTPGYAGIRELGFLDFDVGPPAGESQNSIDEVLVWQNFAHHFTIEKADDNVHHHKGHTHDIRDWNFMQHGSESWPGKLYRLIYPQILAVSGNTGLYILPIFPEGTAP